MKLDEELVKNQILSYITVYRNGQGEITEKKSRFIAFIRYVEQEEDALQMIEELRKEYWDARHCCYAYILGKQGEVVRFSDDGEPGGTAGKPMLEVLQSRRLCNVLAVVIRYFGGTLLGTGGLVRAYSGAVLTGLENSVIITKQLAVKTQMEADYSDLGKLQYIIAQAGIPLAGDIQYTEKVTMTAAIPVEFYDTVLNNLTDATGGRVKYVPICTLYFATEGKNVVLFEE